MSVGVTVRKSTESAGKFTACARVHDGTAQGYGDTVDEALFDLVDHMVSRWTSEVRRLAEGRTEGEDAAFLAGVERANAPPIVCRRCGGTGNLNHFIPWANSATCFDCAGGGEVSHTPDLLLAEWKESRDKA